LVVTSEEKKSGARRSEMKETTVHTKGGEQYI
jgi:hypothetical protein